VEGGGESGEGGVCEGGCGEGGWGGEDGGVRVVGCIVLVFGKGCRSTELEL
jgi:hypothetical protein